MCHNRCCFISRYDNIGTIIYKVVSEVITFVRDDRHTEYTQARMTCHDYFRYRTHADRISPDFSIESVLGRSLEGRACQTYIYTFL